MLLIAPDQSLSWQVRATKPVRWGAYLGVGKMRIAALHRLHRSRVGKYPRLRRYLFDLLPGPLREICLERLRLAYYLTLLALLGGRGSARPLQKIFAENHGWRDILYGELMFLVPVLLSLPCFGAAFVALCALLRDGWALLGCLPCRATVGPRTGLAAGPLLATTGWLVLATATLLALHALVYHNYFNTNYRIVLKIAVVYAGFFHIVACVKDIWEKYWIEGLGKRWEKYRQATAEKQTA